MSVYKYLYIFICLYICILIDTHTHTHTHTHIYIYIYIYIYIFHEVSFFSLFYFSIFSPSFQITFTSNSEKNLAAHTYTYTHNHTIIYMREHTHTKTYTCEHTHTHAHTHTLSQTRLFIHQLVCNLFIETMKESIYLSISVCSYLSINLSMSICSYLSIYLCQSFHIYLSMSVCSYLSILFRHQTFLSGSIYLSIPTPLHNHCPVSLGCRIHWLHLCRRVRPPPNEYPDMTLNNLMVRFQQCWGFWECGVPLYCHRSQVHSGPEW